MNTTGRSDLLIGAAFAILSLLLFFVVTPLGVDVPTASVTEDGSVTPRFFPNFITGLMLVFSVCLLGIGLRRTMRAGKKAKEKKEKQPVNWKHEACRIAAMLTPFALYFTAETLGIVVSSAVLYLLFAAYTGERRYARAVIGAVICTTLLYYFFVHVADVPMPTGTLFSD